MFLRSKIRYFLSQLYLIATLLTDRGDVSVLLAFPSLVKFKDVKISIFVWKICLQQYKLEFERQEIRSTSGVSRDKIGRHQRKTEDLTGDVYIYLMERAFSSYIIRWFPQNNNLN